MEITCAEEPLLQVCGNFRQTEILVIAKFADLYPLVIHRLNTNMTSFTYVSGHLFLEIQDLSLLRHNFPFFSHIAYLQHYFVIKGQNSPFGIVLVSFVFLILHYLNMYTKSAVCKSFFLDEAVTSHSDNDLCSCYPITYTIICNEIDFPTYLKHTLYLLILNIVSKILIIILTTFKYIVNEQICQGT